MPHANQISQSIRQLARTLGFQATGFARAEAVPADVAERHLRWVAEGKNDCMQWAANHTDLRNDPRLLLPGARTVISLAASYLPHEQQDANAAQFARYALGTDYHEVLRKKMQLIADYIQEQSGCECRLCVDSAPIHERYWARQAGIGFIGRNGMLIVPGVGSYVNLCEIITTLELPADEPCTLSCRGCNACIAACPGGAIPPVVAPTEENRAQIDSTNEIQPNGALVDESTEEITSNAVPTDESTEDFAKKHGKSAESSFATIDARCCLSCQLIERRGELPDWVAQKVGNRVLGCDTCQLCCPHNAHAVPTEISEFEMRPALKSITADQILSMTQSQFSATFTHSAVKRTKLAGLHRNVSILKSK